MYAAWIDRCQLPMLDPRWRNDQLALEAGGRMRSNIFLAIASCILVAPSAQSKQQAPGSVISIKCIPASSSTRKSNLAKGTGAHEASKPAIHPKRRGTSSLALPSAWSKTSLPRSLFSAECLAMDPSIGTPSGKPS